MKYSQTIFTLIIVVFTLQAVSSQTTSKSVYGQSNIHGFSINPKFGIYNWAGDDDGFAGGIELNLLKNEFIYSLDLINYEEFVIFGPDPSEYFNQVGLMIGKYRGNDYFRFQYQGGIAPLWGIRRTKLIEPGSGLFGSDEYDTENFFTIGLIAKLGFKVVPTKFLSIGFDLQTNLNPERTVYMPALSIEIGKLRN